MKKTYTRKQIQEAIQYWRKQLRAGNYRKLHESIDTRRIRQDRWYVVNADTQAENADAETQDMIRRGELRFSDGAVEEMFVDGCCPWAGFATAAEANQAAFEAWGAYTDYGSYEDWLEDQEQQEGPGKEHLFSVSATNGDPDPMDRFESVIRVVKGADLVREYNGGR